MSPSSIPRPSFESLPYRNQDPPYSAWGIWGDGDESELGTLNFLTDEVVAEAARSEIRTGVRISLDWPLDKLKNPSFGRQCFERKLLKKGTKIANDDVITLNTQSSSQWDGLRHFGYQREQLFYGGRTMSDFHDDPSSMANSVHKMANKGGITGRGILIDHATWALRHDCYRDGTSHHSIPLSELLAAWVEQGGSSSDFRSGDVLFIRSGFTRTFELMSDDQRLELSKAPPCFTGVETGDEVARWVWEREFAAVAGDAPSWEAWPSKREDDYSLHEIFLAGWGCPIGELFDLEGLAEHCKAVKRWSFFLTSVPLKNPGGAASPPNAVAIF